MSRVHASFPDVSNEGVCSSSDPTDSVPSGNEPVVAAFDFDGTLTRRDSLLPFLWYVAGPLSFAWNTLVLLPTLVRYAAGTLDNGPAKERVLRQFLQGRSVDDLRTRAEQFADDTIPSLLDPEAIQRLRWHQRQGHRVVLVSASVELYLRPWADAMGLDGVIGTRLAVEGGRFTGAFATPNCYGPEKVRRLDAEGPSLQDATMYAYGNSRGDRELLARADHAFYQSVAEPEREDDDSAVVENGLPNHWLRGLLYVGIAAMGLYLGLTLWSGADRILRGISAVSPSIMASVIGLVLAGYFVRFGRWDWYLRRLGEAVPWTTNLRAFFASLAMAATPGKAGESVKAYLLHRSASVAPARSLAGLFTERFTDVFSVVLVIGAGLFSLPQGQWIVLGVGGMQIAVIVALQKPRWLRRAVLLPLAGGARVRRWVRPVDRMLDDTSALLQPGPLLGGIVLGGLPWIGEGIAMYLLFEALGAGSIALHEAILIHAAATLFGAVTFLPGGLGGHEAASVSLSLLYGATQTQAVVATVLIRLATLWFAVLIGGCVLGADMLMSSAETKDRTRQQ